MGKMKPGNPLRVTTPATPATPTPATMRRDPVGARPLTEDEVVHKIACWLDGLESALRDTLHMTNISREERDTLTARIGIYSGIADDVRGRNWRRAT